MDDVGRCHWASDFDYMVGIDQDDQCTVMFIDDLGR